MPENSTDKFVAVWSKFFLEKVSIPLFGSLGLLGNGIAIRNLRNSVIETTFNQSLVTLAICDTLFLGMMIIDQIIGLRWDRNSVPNPTV